MKRAPRGKGGGRGGIGGSYLPGSSKRQAADSELLEHYIAALDEIHYLRALCAQRSLVLGEADDYKSVPKGLRRAIGDCRMMLAEAARGERRTLSRPHLPLRCVHALPTLTREEWERNRGRSWWAEGYAAYFEGSVCAAPPGSDESEEWGQGFASARHSLQD